jgi:hypothetical protein
MGLTPVASLAGVKLMTSGLSDSEKTRSVPAPKLTLLIVVVPVGLASGTMVC